MNRTAEEKISDALSDEAAAKVKIHVGLVKLTVSLKTQKKIAPVL